MQVAYCKVEDGNFGDDLNEIIWKEVLPRAVIEDDDIRIIGIGSILHRTMLKRFITDSKTNLVLGSGVAYGKLDIAEFDCHVLALRGPLSAHYLGMDDKAVTDAGILVADPRVKSKHVQTTPQPGVVGFMPHHDSLKFAHWPRVCRLAGVKFIDPRKSAVAVLNELNGCAKIITEAMHGAIVADAFRIPWIPVTTSARVNQFKWHDWTLSMDLGYQPLLLPMSSMVEKVASRIDAKPPGSDVDWVRQFRTNDRPNFRDVYDRTISEDGAPHQSTLMKRLVRRAIAQSDPVMVVRSARVMREISRRDGHLSDDAVFAAKLAATQRVVADTARYARGAVRGEPAPEAAPVA